MNFDNLIETITAILENDSIEKRGLSLTYELPTNIHLEMNKQIFYKINPIHVDFKPTDEFEVELSGILIKFIKKN
jgi:hypothetical protein